MDLAAAGRALERLGEGALNLGDGVAALLALLEKHAGGGGSAKLRLLKELLKEIDVCEDVARVRRQIEKLLRSDPPPAEIDAFYFGLFDAAGDDGEESVGYYLAGVEGFDPADGDSLCDPRWWPDGRYLSSRALAAVKLAELAAASSEDRELLGYAGMLGMAIFVSKFAATALPRPAAILVGFDSGDFVTIRPRVGKS